MTSLYHEVCHRVNGDGARFIYKSSVMKNDTVFNLSIYSTPHISLLGPFIILEQIAN